MATRAVRVVTEVAAVDRSFDYELPEKFAHVGVGDRVRVNFHNRSVRGWVEAEVEPSRTMKPVMKWLGYGPPPSLWPLLTWAAWRWSAPLSRFLIAASPTRLITRLPEAPVAKALDANVLAQAQPFGPGVCQVSPTTDPLGLILHAYETTRGAEGSLVVVVPSEAWALRLRGRLEQRGCAVAMGDHEWDKMRAGWPVIIGARGAALAPTPRLKGAVIIDADDRALRSEASPTWDAATMLRERCRLDNAPLWMTAVMPSPALLHGSEPQARSAPGDWPRLITVDRRHRDPHEGVLAAPALDAAHRALDGDEAVAVVVVLQRLGTGRLFACRRCGELARCEQCGGPEREVDGLLLCGEGHGSRANFCRFCSSTNLKQVRSGVTTLARDVAAQLSQVVSEVTATTALAPLHRVVVGTEAVFARVRRCGVVIFADFDQYLLAPRADARREAVMAVAKAGRLLGPRREPRGPVIVQTRRHDDVITALETGDVTPLVRDEVATAQILGLAPFGASAEFSGEAAPAFAQALAGQASGVTLHPDGAGGFILRAPDVGALCDLLAATPRPAGRLRLAVE